MRGYLMDKHGAFVPLPKQELQAAWESLRTKYPADFRVSPEQVTAWHSAQAEACLREGNAPAALFHLDGPIKADPANGSLLYRRGQAYARLEQWDKCAIDLANSIKLRKSEEGVADGRAFLALAAAGDTAGHRKACAELLQLFGQIDHPDVTNHVAWVCVRVADTSSDPLSPLRLAEGAVASK